jgi:RNA 2',3'-cyclic 3'-phosphodiesterase
MRVFVGIDIEPSIRERLARFMDGVREFAPEVRWVRPESLHVTLKFIGEAPAEKVEEIQNALSAISVPETTIKFADVGYFPTARSARVFWVGVHAGQELARLAADVEQALVPHGIAAEKRAFSPHLTLARAGSGAPARRPEDRGSRRFQRVQERLAALPAPDFGTMTAREFFLYESKLSPKGAQYTKVARFGR